MASGPHPAAFAVVSGPHAAASATAAARPHASPPGNRTGPFWFGAELDSDGDQVWFRIADETLGRMPEKTPRGPRPSPSRRPHRLDHAGPRAPARHQPLRGPGLRGRRHVVRTAAVVKGWMTFAPLPAGAELERPARRPRAASVSPNTRRAYSGARRRLDAWLAGRPLEDATLASYLGELRDQGRAPASAAPAVAAACFRARLAEDPTPSGGTDGPGPRPATGGPPAIGAGGKRGRSGRRT